MSILTPEQSTLGKKAPYETHYNPELLFPIPRSLRRDEIGIGSPLPFFGVDIWNHYEVSWLNERGKPIVALAEIIYGCESVNIIESKSMKLYFNSLNNSVFSDIAALENIIRHDLAVRLDTTLLRINLWPLQSQEDQTLHARFSGINIDNQDIECHTYHCDPTLLTTNDNIVTETLCSDLLKSNCLVTNQPDWCSIEIRYTGRQIDQAGLLRYIVSFRNDNEFHEQCIEKIFIDIQKRCQPTTLSVYGRSTRRGGVDINSWRSSVAIDLPERLNFRLCRQ